MSLDASIRALVEQGTISALNEHLPALLERFTAPVDPDERLTIGEAAEYLRMPAKTVRLRITDGSLMSFKDGIRSYILRRDLITYNSRLRDAAQAKRDQSARRSVPKHIDADIIQLLQPTEKAANTAKKKARH